MSSNQVHVPNIIIYKHDGTEDSFIRHEPLGHGSFGIVFRVTDTKTKEDYAIKVLPKERYDGPKHQKRLEKLKREFNIQKNLNHPNIVKAYYMFSDNYNYYILLEYCPRGTIRDLIKVNTKPYLNEEETVKILRDIVNGVVYLHKNHIIHRDLKLTNYMIGSDGKVKLADFGLSNLLMNEDEKRYTICGTPAYTSPELLQDINEGYDYEVDVWAIGVSAFAMLTGHHPFEGKKKSITFENIRNCEYDFPPDIQISLNAKDFIMTIFKVDPKWRPSAAELLNHPFLKSFDDKSTQSSLLENKKQSNIPGPVRPRETIMQKEDSPLQNKDKIEDKMMKNNNDHELTKEDSPSQDKDKMMKNNNDHELSKEDSPSQNKDKIEDKMMTNNNNDHELTKEDSPLQNKDKIEDKMMTNNNNDHELTKEDSPLQDKDKIEDKMIKNNNDHELTNEDSPLQNEGKMMTNNNNDHELTKEDSPLQNEEKIEDKIMTNNNNNDHELTKDFKIPKFLLSEYLFHDKDLCYLLLDGTVGVCFEDKSRMIMDPNEKFIQYYKKHHSYAKIVDLDAYLNKTNKLKKIKFNRKIKLVKKIAKKLKKTKSTYELQDENYDSSVPLHHVKYFLNKDGSIIFRFNDKNTQVNFFDDEKLIIFNDKKKMCLVKNMTDGCKLLSLEKVSKMPENCNENKKLLVAKELLSELSKN